MDPKDLILNTYVKVKTSRGWRSSEYIGVYDGSFVFRFIGTDICTVLSRREVAEMVIL
jgi:hypothetical protein